MAEKPDEAQRFFGEKVVSGEYKKVLVVMQDEGGSMHLWYDCDLSDAMGLARWAELQTAENFNKLLDDEEDG